MVANSASLAFVVFFMGEKMGTDIAAFIQLHIFACDVDQVSFVATAFTAPVITISPGNQCAEINLIMRLTS